MTLSKRPRIVRLEMKKTPKVSQKTVCVGRKPCQMHPAEPNEPLHRKSPQSFLIACMPEFHFVSAKASSRCQIMSKQEGSLFLVGVSFKTKVSSTSSALLRILLKDFAFMSVFWMVFGFHLWVDLVSL